MWVRAEDVPVGKAGPPQIKALVLGRNEEGMPDEVQLELFWKLGEVVRDRVRLIAIRTLQSPEDQATTARAVERLANYLVKAMPGQEPAAAADPSTRNLLRLNLIIDAAEETGLRGSDVFQPDWEANIVASPEDRTTPNSADAPPLHPRMAQGPAQQSDVFGMDRPERYYGWALAHLATVAGIWANIPNSVYDLSVDRPAVGHSMCLIQRVTVRGVISDGLAIDLALDVLSEVAAGDSDLELQQDAMLRHRVDVVAPHAVAARSEALTEFTLDHMDSQGFRYMARPLSPAERAVDVSLGSRIGLFFRLLLRGLLSLPRFLMQLFLRRLSAKMTVEGGDAVVVADMSWRGGLPSVDEGMFTIPPVADDIADSVKAPPQFWRDMRQLLLASLDAGEAPASAATMLRNSGSGNPTVYPRRGDLIPDPSHVWHVPDECPPDMAALVDLRWSDAEASVAQLNGVGQLLSAPKEQAVASPAEQFAAAAERSRRQEHLKSLVSQEQSLTAELQRLLEDCTATIAAHPHAAATPAGTSNPGGPDGS